MPEVLRSQFFPPIKHVAADNPWLQLLTPHQLVEINSAFAKFDRDGDGHIEAKEISRVMKNLGCPQSDEKIKELIQLVDQDGNDKIEFDEFISIMASRMFSVAEGESELQQAFKLFEDDTKPGHVKVSTVKEILGKMGSSQMSDADLEQLLSKLSVDADGRVEMSQFKSLDCWNTVLPPVSRSGGGSRKPRTDEEGAS